MTDISSAASGLAQATVLSRLSALDRYLPVWIIAAMAVGLLLGRFVPGVADVLDAVQVESVSLRLARCIARVMIWNEFACGDREVAAVLVAINSVFQVLASGALGWFYLQVLPGRLGMATTTAGFSVVSITLSVLVFLGVPLLAGFLTRTLGEKKWGREHYEAAVLPRLGPWALYGLLFTIVVLFARQGRQVTDRPWEVARIALPLIVYFVITFGLGFGLGRSLGLGCAGTTTLVCTAAGNNFELAIAVAIGTFGVNSGQAPAGVVGPLIEVPALVALVHAAPWLRRRGFPAEEPGNVTADAANRSH